MPIGRVGAVNGQQGLVPTSKLISQLLQGIELGFEFDRRGILEGAGEHVHGVNHAILGRQRRLSEVRRSELDGVQHNSGLGLLVGHCETSVVLERGTEAESVSAALVPRFAFGWFVVDDDTTSHLAEGRCRVVK